MVIVGLVIGIILGVLFGIGSTVYNLSVSNAVGDTTGQAEDFTGDEGVVFHVKQDERVKHTLSGTHTVDANEFSFKH